MCYVVVCNESIVILIEKRTNSFPSLELNPKPLRTLVTTLQGLQIRSLPVLDDDFDMPSVPSTVCGVVSKILVCNLLAVQLSVSLYLLSDCQLHFIMSYACSLRQKCVH